MKHILLAGFAMIMLASCSGEPTLQKYYVEKGAAPGFVSLDIAPTFINTDKVNLSAEEKEALNSLQKFNVLVYRNDSLDTTHKKYNAEMAKVKTLVKNEYEELIKINDGTSGASISTKGEGEHIEEFVVFVHNEDNGFGVVRVLGDDMNPNNVLTIAGLLQKANIDRQQFKPLEDLMSKKK